MRSVDVEPMDEPRIRVWEGTARAQFHGITGTRAPGGGRYAAAGLSLALACACPFFADGLHAVERLRPDRLEM